MRMPVYFLSIEQFNHVAVVAKVSVPPPNSNLVPTVTVADAETGRVEYIVQPYPSYFHGGINVTVGDVNCDGIPDLIVAPQQGFAPLIEIYDGTPDVNGNYAGSLINSFYAYNQNFLGGMSVALGDVNFDGHQSLVVGFGPGYAPVIEVFAGGTLLNAQPSLLGSPFLAFNNSFTINGSPEAIGQNFFGGVNVAVGDLTNNGYANIVATVASNGPAIVNVFNGNGYGFMVGFYAFNSANVPGGLTLAVGDVTGDGVRDIIVGSAPGYTPFVNIFSGATLFSGGIIRARIQRHNTRPAEFPWVDGRLRGTDRRRRSLGRADRVGDRRIVPACRQWRRGHAYLFDARLLRPGIGLGRRRLGPERRHRLGRRQRRHRQLWAEQSGAERTGARLHQHARHRPGQC